MIGQLWTLIKKDGREVTYKEEQGTHKNEQKEVPTEELERPPLPKGEGQKIQVDKDRLEECLRQAVLTDLAGPMLTALLDLVEWNELQYESYTNMTKNRNQK